mmetsp:Transcript_88564/g.236704  ORF Transcript_88564/g.236704 Transcript_88564/m.236704 type:complete len:239 (-) Transcript_88564:1443-2159(-)
MYLRRSGMPTPSPRGITALISRTTSVSKFAEFISTMELPKRSDSSAKRVSHETRFSKTAFGTSADDHFGATISNVTSRSADLCCGTSESGTPEPNLVGDLSPIPATSGHESPCVLATLACETSLLKLSESYCFGWLDCSADASIAWQRRYLCQTRTAAATGLGNGLNQPARSSSIDSGGTIGLSGADTEATGSMETSLQTRRIVCSRNKLESKGDVHTSILCHLDSSTGLSSATRKSL